jgi:hypothetical protein
MITGMIQVNPTSMSLICLSQALATEAAQSAERRQMANPEASSEGASQSNVSLSVARPMR